VLDQLKILLNSAVIKFKTYHYNLTYPPGVSINLMTTEIVY